MSKELTPKKKQRDLIVAALELLKAKGHDINPYTVADEAGIPRSALYRNTEYMDLLREARGEKAEEAAPVSEESNNQIREFEERCKQLEENIWNLEADAEKLLKEKQEAWNLGFQAGREDATQQFKAAEAERIANEAKVASARDAESSAADTRHAEQLAHEIHAAEARVIEASATEIAALQDQLAEVQAIASAATSALAAANNARLAAESAAAQSLAQAQSAAQALSAAPAAGTVAPAVATEPTAAAPVAAASATQQEFSPDRSRAETGPIPVSDSPGFFQNGELGSGGAAAPGQQEFQPPPSAPLDTNGGSGSSAPAPAPSPDKQASSRYAKSTSQDGVFNIVRSGPTATSNYNPLVELSWRDVEAVYNYAAANLKDIADQIEHTTSQENVAFTPDLQTSEPNQQAQAQSQAPTQPNAQHLVSQDTPSNEAMEAYRKYAYTESATALPQVEGVFDGISASEPGMNTSSWFPTGQSLTSLEPIVEGAEVVEEEFQRTPSWDHSGPGAEPVPYQFGTQPAAAAAGSAVPSASDVAQSHFQSWAQSQQLSPELLIQPGQNQGHEDSQPMMPPPNPPKRQSYLDLGFDEEEQEQQPAAAAFGSSPANGSGIPQPTAQQFADSYGAGFTAQQFHDLQSRDVDPAELAARERGRKTEDRLQAFSDPRDFADSEAVVDLDELDIFDDLDDYVDLDTIEIISDVPLQDKAAAEEEKTAGDELRDLIKGRMKQAAEMPADLKHTAGLGSVAGAAAAGAPADKAAAAAAGGGMGARHKFVGAKAQSQTVESSTTQQPPVQQTFIPKIPPEMRKHCMILGIPADPELLSKDKVMQAWKNQIAAPGVHPDLGGDTEAAIALNTAKDVLVRWLEANTPKLGNKFQNRNTGLGSTAKQPPVPPTQQNQQNPGGGQQPPGQPGQ